MVETILWRPSPNFDDRGAGTDIDTLVLHYTGMQSGEAALARLTAEDAKVSAHYCVEEDGTIYQLVREEMRAWHAGVSSWQGQTNLNARSIGVEIVNPGHEFGYRPFPDPQMASVVTLTRDIVRRQAIPARNVVGHSDIAPSRKEDPGELFNWQQLAGEGVGLWFDDQWSGNSDLSSLGEGDQGDAVAAVQSNLRGIGYGIPASGCFDTETAAVVRAFQRHWRPRQVDGIADGETRSAVAAIMEQVRRLTASSPQLR